MDEKKNWFGSYIGEALGVFFIVFFGCGVVAVAVLLGQMADLWAVGATWGLTVALAVYAGASMSGAHFNPGVTLALALRRNFPWSQVIPYIISQIIGGFLGAVALASLYGNMMAAELQRLGLQAGQAGSQLVSMIYTTYTPNPRMVGIDAPTAQSLSQYGIKEGWSLVSLLQGAWGEILATALLMICILMFLEARSINSPESGKVAWFFPIALAVAVTMIVVVEAPITQVSLNGARDLGPRIWAWVQGYGSIAFPGPRGDWWIGSIAPAIGAILGAYFFDFVMLPFFPKARPTTPEVPATRRAPQPAGD
jgi:glycerol uptake facilitator protein